MRRLFLKWSTIVVPSDPAVAGLMKKSTASWSVCFLGALLLLSTMCEALRPSPVDATAGTKDSGKDLLSKESTGGSSLPDCSHACGPCSPCKRVMVSFKCTVAESCPIVYRCMCKGKYYHVPSN